MKKIIVAVFMCAIVGGGFFMLHQKKTAEYPVAILEPFVKKIYKMDDSAYTRTSFERHNLPDKVVIKFTYDYQPGQGEKKSGEVEAILINSSMFRIKRLGYESEQEKKFYEGRPLPINNKYLAFDAILINGTPVTEKHLQIIESSLIVERPLGNVWTNIPVIKILPFNVFDRP